ncbi:hypothetical protein TNCV_4280321 [Trichonephila clavipes]|nr:hypothetical protein TNCV_4280321 [Trichonephila clavipes]
MASACIRCPYQWSLKLLMFRLRREVDKVASEAVITSWTIILSLWLAIATFFSLYTASPIPVNIFERQHCIASTIE